MICIDDPTILNTAGSYSSDYKQGFEFRIHRCQDNCKPDVDEFINRLYMFGYMQSAKYDPNAYDKNLVIKDELVKESLLFDSEK